MDMPIDILKDLNRYGMTDSAIARNAGVSQPTIWRIRNAGANCSFKVYRALVVLRDKHMTSAASASSQRRKA